MAKKLSKHVRCIAGGPQASFNEKQLLNIGCFDTIVSGYGEEAVLDALTNKGIIAKQLIKNKDYIPDYSDIPIENYGHRLPVITTRGCPNRCTFCTQHLPLYVHPVESVITQITSTPNTREVMYNDSNMNISTNRIESLFDKISSLKSPPRGHVFGMEIKEGFERYISKMADAGVKVARVGIESGSLRERGSMNKPLFDNNLAIKFIRELTENRIMTWVQFIFCYPDQTDEDREATLKLMNQINDSCNTSYIKHFWYRYIVHNGTEELFYKKYGVVSNSPLNWNNKLYTPEKIEALEKKYSPLVPENSKILL